MTRAFPGGGSDERGLQHEQAARAGLGACVTIRRGILVSDVWIVGEDEADPPRGRIGSTAPLARALAGARKGDVIELETGERVEEVRVLAVHSKA